MQLKKKKDVVRYGRDRRVVLAPAPRGKSSLVVVGAGEGRLCIAPHGICPIC